MTAYFIYARQEITNEEVSKQYSQQAVPQIREFGGEGAVQALEGDWLPQSVTILRFDDREALFRWYESPEYAPLKQMRLDSNVGDIIVVDAGQPAATQARSLSAIPAGQRDERTGD